jgi:vacuolar-type H+-ATPase subunit F/Vma7
LLSFVIGDHDMVTGFRLVGVEGVEAKSPSQAKEALANCLKRHDIAIILVSEEFSHQICDDIDKIRTENVSPLILEIPSSRAPSQQTRLSESVSKILGFKI